MFEEPIGYILFVLTSLIIFLITHKGDEGGGHE